MTLDPVTLSVMRSALEGVAAEMGSVLVRSAYSSNIKERRDCSAALFDDRGRMVAQAEHIPVHLGAMPEAVAAVMARGAQPGDVFALNDPYTGGTHLPDITLVSPIAVDDARWATRSRAPTTPTSAAWCRDPCPAAAGTSGRRAWSSRRSGWSARAGWTRTCSR